MCVADSTEGMPGLPPWARVTERRRGHIQRVTSLLVSWADALGLDGETRRAWRDAGLWHDALRDADEPTLRALVPEAGYPTDLLHGPAASAMLERTGERRADVLDAIRWHTVGSRDWERTGRALYMADFLEPGRKFARKDRAFLAARVPEDFDGVLRQVTRQRLEWALREGHELYAETVALWNAVR
jgi:2-amino-4-hydroxy-6-hydroxymethyldihydropteridine diphosphokinase